MNRRFLVVSALGAALVAGVATTLVSPTSVAAPPSTPPAASAASEPTTVATFGTLLDTNFRWGMTHANVVEIYNRPGGIFDAEYQPHLARMQPGTRMESLIADREARKRNLLTAFIEFKDIGTGFDGTSMRPEYTYRNLESMLWVNRRETKKYYFFFGAQPNEKLWKMYEEVPLKADGILGPTFQEAVTKLGAVIGAPGKLHQPADPTERPYVDWQDALTNLRVVDRTAEHVVGIVFAERATLSRLDQLRSNKQPDLFAIDPLIANAMRQNRPPPPAASSAAPRR